MTRQSPSRFVRPMFLPIQRSFRQVAALGGRLRGRLSRMLATLVLLILAGSARPLLAKTDTAIVSVPVSEDMTVEVIVEVDGEFDYLVWENSLNETNDRRLTLHAPKGGLQIGQDSFSVSPSPGVQASVRLADTRFEIDASGRLDRVGLDIELAWPDGTTRSHTVEIHLVMDMAYAFYEPATLTVQNIQSEILPSGDRSYVFDIKFDITGSQKAIRWDFLRWRVIDGAGESLLGPEHREVFSDAQARTQVRVLQGVSVAIPSEAPARGSLSFHGIVVGEDEDGLLVVERLEFPLP